MRAIIFSPVKAILQHDQADWRRLADCGAITIVTDAGSHSRVRDHLPQEVEVLGFERINDSAAIELEVLEYAKVRSVDKVLFLSEIDVLRAARISDRLGHSTDMEQRLSYFRDKFKMKERAARQGVPIAPMAVISSGLDAFDFAEKWGFPCVLKPRDGRGSGGVRVIKSKDALKEALSQLGGLTFHNLMIEQYVEGVPYQVNGLYLNGEATIVSVCRVAVDCLEFLAGKSHLIIMEDEGSINDALVAFLRDLMERVYQPNKTTLFHLEVFVRADGTIVLGEIACRVGGCFINDMMAAGYGIDPRMTYLLAELGGDVGGLAGLLHPRSQVGQISIPPRIGRLEHLPFTCDLESVIKYSASDVEGQYFDGMALTNGELINALVEGGSADDVLVGLKELDAWVSSHSRWIATS